MAPLPPNHFLSVGRPDLTVGQPFGMTDTSTLAAHDFDVDTRTGFLPPEPPLTRLPIDWEPWEAILDDALQRKLQLGDRINLSDEDIYSSASWRARVSSLALLPTDNLNKSEVMLRRAHHVLTFIMHIYIHTLPPDAEVRIPAPITIPLLRVCSQLQLPPINTYTDNVLYNWALKYPSPSGLPTLGNLRTQTLFTGTTDEEEFYLTSTRIELRGVEALELMRATMDEAFVGDDIAFRRITTYLQTMSGVISELKTLLLAIRKGCDPDVFYRDIRPWFRGADSDPRKRKWIFDGLEDHPDLQEPTELSGPSAGQSPLIHALDIFLGVDSYSHSSNLTGHSTTSSVDKVAFLTRMQSYMSRHHRNFLRNLSDNPRPLRTLVLTAGDPALLEAYNAAVQSLKEFRDAHMIIVALYILGPAKRARVGDQKMKEEARDTKIDATNAPLRGTGGTNLVRFLKGVRDQTAGALVNSPNDVRGTVEF